ncbi:MAG: hypothetical protein FD145_70 [Candidatus Saganbacteria bacterium]|uniref:Radical SAM core domain-containing protein n=1 Tax=Candidatus Saganbacteria bacterium TaxID=2575572 RepID=A0A833L2M6_UNCSA|nr:MAG: hypothetical protein FD145_70 [Candidatus Saganbacteria bacterium]
MYKVCLVVPGWHYWANPSRIQPLYELYFATLIEEKLAEEVEVSIVDTRGLRQDQRLFHIPKKDLYIYWIPKTGDYTWTRKLVAELKQSYPMAKHAAGGTHIDIFPDESMKDFDAVMVGPGEGSLLSLIKDAQQNTLQKLYRSDYKDFPFGDFSFMRRHFLPETAIVNSLLFEKYGKNIRSTCVLFSRGCAFRCKFCVYNVPSMVQMRSPKSMLEEIQYLKSEYHIDAINLKDEICIPVSRTIAVEYMEAIGRGKVSWRGQTTVLGITEEKMALAKKTGCVELAIGVESASQQVLDIINKGITLDQVRGFINLARKYDIRIKMCLVFGLPGEPENIVNLTKAFVEETNPDYVSLSGLDPIPGSDIYNNYKEYGIKYIDQDWEKHAHLMFRFSDYEEVGLPFEYELSNKWGKTFSREKLAENTRIMQRYLREQNKTY